MGQEELANIVGVSVPAVSKWECGKSYPDITLLPVLAKTLNSSVDALFSYSATLSEDEIDKLMTEYAKTFDEEGFDKGYAMLEELVTEYPNDVLLKCSLGAIFSMYSGKFPDGRRNECLEKAIELCKPATQSENATWQRAGKKCLPVFI